MEHLIRDAGFTPARRKQDYTLVNPAPAIHADAA